MSKNLDKNEINLLDIFQVLWNKKFQIFIFIAISLATALYIEATKPLKELKVNATTEIRSISTYDEAKYKIYNSVINKFKPFYENKQFVETPEIIIQNDNQELSSLSDEMFIEGLQINNINRNFLFNLFLDKLNDKYYLMLLIKKFNLIKKEDYLDKLAYENAVKKLATSINLININDVYFININATEIKQYEEFLEFIEIEINNEIQRELFEMIDSYLSYIDIINNYFIDDIDTQLSITQNEKEIKKLQKQKNLLSTNKYVERVKTIFESSPVSKPDEFYAAKVYSSQTEYEREKPYPILKTFVVSGLLGALVGIFYVLIVNSAKRQK